MNNHHAALNSSTRPINRVNQNRAYRANSSKARHQLNSRPGIFNNLVFLPSINSCLVNPLYVVNLNCHNLNSVLVELTNLATLTVNQPHNHKLKVNEPLLTLTPYLCFFLSPFHAGVNQTSMDYYRYL